MSLRFESLFAGLFPNVGTVVYTAPPGYRTLLKSYIIDNTDGAAPHTYTIALTKGGNIVYTAIAINMLANGTSHINDISIVLNPGDTITVAASAANFIHGSFDGISQSLT